MHVLSQVHVDEVPPAIKRRLQHDAIDAGMPLYRWVNCIFAYVTSNREIVQEIYTEWLASEGKLGTEPELPAVKKEEVAV